MIAQESQAQIENQEETLIEWRVHLMMKERPYRVALAIIAPIACLVLGFQIMRDIIPHTFVFAAVIGIFGLIFFFSLADFFFPIRYRLTSRGAYTFSWTGIRFIEWKRVKKAYKNESGIKLSIFQYPSPWESFRGMYLQFGDNRDELISVVKRIVNPDPEGNS